MARTNQAVASPRPKFELPKVPFPLGTKVRPKQGPDRQYEWTVYDHHGVTWEIGIDPNRVVLVRPIEAKRGDPDYGGMAMIATTWGRIEEIKEYG